MIEVINDPAPPALTQSRIDEIGAILNQHNVGDELPLNHVFTPGLYTREIFMPKGMIVLSKIHKTTHPYVISAGRVSVWTTDGKIVQLQAPHTGITTPGTQRLIYVHEDTIWSTFHPTEETDLEKIEDQIIEPHVNPLISQETIKQLQSHG